MKHPNPAMVTVVSQLSGQKRKMPHRGGRVSTSELESLMTRLRTLLKVTAHLAETVEQIRIRALYEQKFISEPMPTPSPTSDTPLAPPLSS